MNNLFNNPHILLVEDDKPLAELVKSFLNKNGFSITVTHTAAETQKQLLKQSFVLIVLDIGLPDCNSFDLCTSIRKHCLSPIIVFTARSSNADQIEGLELGADDYLIKPVEPKLLLARINALLRRSRQNKDSHSALNKLGGLSINCERKEAFFNGSRMDLSTQEFNLLWVLASHAGETLDRDYLLKTLRGIGFDGLDRSIDVKISKLRRKLNDDSENPQIIKTVWGQGYLFVTPAIAASKQTT